MDLFDRASELEQQQRDDALAKARMAPSEQPDEQYGVRWCLSCGEVIPVQRLEKVPRAVRCIGCQSAQESRSGGRHA